MKSKTEDKLSPVMLSLRRMEKLIGSSALGSIVFSKLQTSGGVRTLITAYNAGSVVEAVLKSPIEGLDAAWEFPYAQLNTMVQTRSDLTFEIRQGTLYISGKRYNSTLVGVESAAVLRAEKPESGKSVILNQELWDTMREALGKVHLQRNPLLPDLDVHFSFKEKTVLVSAYDRYQIACYKIKNKTGQKLELTLPLSKATSMFKDFMGDCSLLLTSEYIFAQVGNVRMLSPTVSSEDDSLTYEEHIEPKLKAILDTTADQVVTVKKSEVQDFLSNAKALAKSTTQVDIKAKDGKLLMSMSADGNQVKSKVSTTFKGELSFRIDVSYLSSMLSKSGEDLSFSIDESMVRFSSGPVTYVAVLSV